ncbi:unnamed protein product [Owenia fusiformis]|uniref:Uncharacterized protein n=1 Tax=Owenia fusiformis TaxID=6347 RepID=A0A8S4NH34_OWEFU|nr:unnamed protein product [Owenia fusiformis]
MKTNSSMNMQNKTRVLTVVSILLISLYVGVYNTFSTKLVVTYPKMNAVLQSIVALRNEGNNEGNHTFLNQMLLDELTKGYWKPKYVTDEYKKYVIDRVKRARDFNNMEYSNDTKCSHETGSYRTLCNSVDKKACCKENTCQDIPVANCTCPTCFDERPRIHPEFYDWTPYRAHMRKNISGKDICTGLRYLNVSSMIILGDSLIRNFYHNFRRRVANETKAEDTQGCRSDDHVKDWRDDACKNRTNVGSSVQICNQIKFLFKSQIHVELGSTKDAMQTALKEMKKDTLGQMLVLTDIGLWTDLNTQIVSVYLDQLLQETNALGETHIIYMTPYIPGIRKSPRWTGQTKEKSIEFAKYFRTFTKERKISFLDPTELVKNLVSWDGTHYTFGLDDALIDIIAAYIIRDL